MSIVNRIRETRGGESFVYLGQNNGNYLPPLLRHPDPVDRQLQARQRCLTSAHAGNIGTFKLIPPIPEDDLRILEKIYHKEYADCGRKRGALIRYIKHYRKTEEPVNHSHRLIKHIQKLARKHPF